jgi:hypothetical protein
VTSNSQHTRKEIGKGQILVATILLCINALDDSWTRANRKKQASFWNDLESEVWLGFCDYEDKTEMLELGEDFVGCSHQ